MSHDPETMLQSRENSPSGPALPRSALELPQRGLLFCAAILGAAVLVAMMLSLPVGYAILGNKMVFLAGSLAGGVCLLAGLVVLALSHVLYRPQQALALVGLAMLVRMGMPLAMVLATCLCGGPLANAGILYYVIVFYLITLTVETLLVLPRKRPAKKQVSARQDFAG